MYKFCTCWRLVSSETIIKCWSNSLTQKNVSEHQTGIKSVQVSNDQWDTVAIALQMKTQGHKCAQVQLTDIGTS